MKVERVYLPQSISFVHNSVPVCMLERKIVDGIATLILEHPVEKLSKLESKKVRKHTGASG